jgi:hypothetical protein
MSISLPTQVTKLTNFEPDDLLQVLEQTKKDGAVAKKGNVVKIGKISQTITPNHRKKRLEISLCRGQKQPTHHFRF